MAKGRTGAEIIKSWFVKPEIVESKFYNPLGAKIGSHVRLQNLEGFTDELLLVTQIAEWDRTINGNSHKTVDYILEAEGPRLVMRVIPQIKRGGEASPTILLLQQYWPAEPGPQPWGEESPYVLDALMDPTGELVQNQGTSDELRYFRDLCNIHASVSMISDLNNDGSVTLDEVVTVPMSLWTFRRTTTDVANQEFEEHFHVQLSGHYNDKTKKVNGGDKDLLMLRGEVLLPSNFVLY